MDIRQLEYFIAVARLRSYTKPPTSCSSRSQALSKAVHNLEQELGGNAHRPARRHAGAH